MKMYVVYYFIALQFAITTIIYAKPSQHNDSILSQSIRIRRADRQDLCMESGCDCINTKGQIITIECNFTTEYRRIELNQNFYLPEEVRAVTIRLSAGSELILSKGFFTENRVNGFVVEGDPNELNSQVIVKTNSFIGNLDSFPDIEFINLDNVELYESSFHGEIKLNISHCNKVIIKPETFSQVSLWGTFESIKNLNMKEGAFSRVMNSTRLIVINSYMSELNYLGAAFRQMSFNNCNIRTILPRAFDVININSITFDKCKIESIEENAITEKLLGSYLSITNSEIWKIAGGAIKGSGIQTIELINNLIDTIENNAIKVFAVNNTIINNRIKRLGDKWYDVSEWNEILIYNNTFGEYHQMAIQTISNPSDAKCLFKRNQITRIDKNDKDQVLLNTEILPYCHVTELMLAELCSCYMEWLDKSWSHQLRTTTYCSVGSVLKHCFNSTIYNVQEYERLVCNKKSKLNCMQDGVRKNLKANFYGTEEIDGKHYDLFYYFILFGVILFIGLVIIVVRLVRRCIITKMANCNQQYASFSEEDNNVINQTRHLVQKKYSEYYSELFGYISRLDSKELDEQARLELVDKILNVIHEIPNQGTDFVPFNNVLRKYLKPRRDYFMQPFNDTDNTVPLQQGTAPPIDLIGPEHIYAEPGSAQQPLLPVLAHDYSSPLDGTNPENIYAEPTQPVTNPQTSLVSPYAVSSNPVEPIARNKNETIYPTPANVKPRYVPKNLPDILPSTSGVMAEELKLTTFGNNPKYHINRSPTTNRQIPEYTIPSKVKNTTFDKDDPGAGAQSLAYQQTDSMSKSSSVNSISSHSGASGATANIADIDYIDNH